MTPRLIPSAFVLLLVTQLGACGDHDHDHDHDNASVSEEFCEHMADGPSIPVNATDPAAEVEPPSVNEPHTRYDITLVEAEGSFIGAVTYAAGEAGHHAIALSDDVPLQVFNAEGNEIAPHHRNGQSALCTEVAADAGYELEIGTATIVIGPTDSSSVSLVIELDMENETHDHP